MRTRFVRTLGAVAVAAVAATMLASCSSGNGGDVRLQLAATTDADQSVYAELIKDFEQKNPGVEVKTTFTPNEQFQTTVPRSMGSSSGPDIVAAFPGIGAGPSAFNLQDSGLVVDQSKKAWAADLSDAQKSVLGHDGFVAFNPIGSDTIGIIYDTDFFQKSKLTAPATWSELLDLCGTIKDKGIIPISLGLQTNYVTQFIPYALVASTVYAADPTFDDELLAGEGTFADSGWKAALQKFIDMRDAGCFGDSAAGTTYDSMLQQVATKQAAMTISVGPSLGPIRKADPAGKYVIVPLPAYDDAAKNGVPQASSIGLAINKKSKHVAAAQKFVDFVNEPENLAKLAGGYNVIPRGDATAPEGLEAMAKAFGDQPTGIFPNQLWKSPTSIESYMAAVQQLFSDQQSVGGVLKAMDDAYQPLK